MPGIGARARCAGPYNRHLGRHQVRSQSASAGWCAMRDKAGLLICILKPSTLSACTAAENAQVRWLPPNLGMYVQLAIILDV